MMSSLSQRIASRRCRRSAGTSLNLVPDIIRINMEKRQEEIKQFIKFSLCSMSAWLTDFALFTLLYQVIKVNYIVSKGIAYTLGATVSFLLNRRFTFGRNLAVKDILGRFIITNICAQTMSLLSMAFFRDVVGLTVWQVYFVSFVFSFTTNYIGNRFWVFRDKQKERV